MDDSDPLGQSRKTFLLGMKRRREFTSMRESQSMAVNQQISKVLLLQLALLLNVSEIIQIEFSGASFQHYLDIVWSIQLKAKRPDSGLNDSHLFRF